MKFAKNKKELDKQEEILDKMYGLIPCPHCGETLTHICQVCGEEMPEQVCKDNVGLCDLCVWDLSK